MFDSWTTLHAAAGPINIENWLADKFRVPVSDVRVEFVLYDVAKQQQMLGQGGLAGVRMGDDGEGAPSGDLGGERVHNRPLLAGRAGESNRSWWQRLTKM